MADLINFLLGQKSRVSPLVSPQVSPQASPKGQEGFVYTPSDPFQVDPEQEKRVAGKKRALYEALGALAGNRFANPIIASLSDEVQAEEKDIQAKQALQTQREQAKFTYDLQLKIAQTKNPVASRALFDDMIVKKQFTDNNAAFAVRKNLDQGMTIGDAILDAERALGVPVVKDPASKMQFKMDDKAVDAQGNPISIMYATDPRTGEWVEQLRTPRAPTTAENKQTKTPPGFNF